MVKVCTLCKFYITDHGMVFHPICNTVLIVSQSEICNLSGLSPAELIRRGEEEEVRNHSSSRCDIPSGVHCINVRTCTIFHSSCMFISVGVLVKVISKYITNLLQEFGGYYIVNGLEKLMRMLIMPRRNYVSY